MMRHVAALTNGALNEIRDAVSTVDSEIASGPIVPKVAPDEIRNYLISRFDFQRPIALNEVVADVEQMLRNWQVQVTHPRYFGLFNPSVTLASIVADLLSAIYNPQLATWRTSPAANEIERHTLGWLSSKFGLPSNSAAHFTSGGAEANHTAVIAALTRAFPAYGEHGLRSLAASPTIYLTAETHAVFNKIAHATGLGRSALRTVATDADLKLNMQDLARQVSLDRAAGFAPILVVGTGGTTAAGVIDPLHDLARFCRNQDLWFHADAAWGGAAAISPALRPCLAGIEDADSITCDAHKWFSVPMAAGMFFCRHPQVLADAFRAETYIMPGKIDGRTDPYISSMQWSRRFIGLKLFMALAERGEPGYAEMIDHQTRMGELLRDLLRRSGWRILNSTPLPVVCFTRERLDISKFVATLLEGNIAWMSPVKLSNGVHAVRACVTSFRTTEQDVRDVVDAMGRIP
jgi:aromatic-L-amino-acid decarboxylase